ncbi:MAG TPA: nickel pincer cofactor biosynthesis protein LarC [Myxococcota bacterium]|nr:nickel pincer cofactor biosynthesis protein LarC [Myxococcota bacterium]
MLHLDLFSGIAGNMFLGALLDAGLSRSALAQGLEGLGLAHALRVRKVRRGAIAACYLEVVVPRRKRESRAPAQRRARGDHADARGARADAHGRSFREIEAILRRAALDARVRDRALAIFDALGRAEAKVHGISLERVHFHEVGAVDAIVDVAGAAIGLAQLGIERVTASPVALGEGSVDTEHGRLPLPSPATFELLRGIPTVPAHVRWETVTPTGAAILRTVADEFGAMPAMTVESIGHGAGDDRKGALPNVLRAAIGRSGGASADRVVCLETNLDDFIPEHFDHLMERLLEAGALDVSVLHQQMKKNRPGFLLRVLARPSDRIPLAHILFEDSTAIGVRATDCERIVLDREARRVATRYGRIRVKRTRDGAGRAAVSAEYDDCKRAARRAGVPLREVVRAAEEAGRAAFD